MILTVIVAALAGAGLAAAVKYRRRQELYIVVPLLLATFVGVLGMRLASAERDELRHFVKESCELLSDQLYSDATEFRHMTAPTSSSTPQDVLRLQTHYLRASIERAQLAKKCVAGPLPPSCLPPAIATTNVDAILRAADALRAGKCPN